MPRTTEASQRIRAEQHKKILEAAGRVFARMGLAATMDDVASEAGVSHGLTYRYFTSKEALLYELLKQALGSPEASLERVLEIPGTPGERLRLMIAGFVESRRRPEIYMLLERAMNDEDSPPELRELMHRRGEALQSALRELIVAGQASGEVAAGDPQQLARAIIACLDGLIRWAERAPESYGEHYPDPGIFLRMLKP